MQILSKTQLKFIKKIIKKSGKINKIDLLLVLAFTFATLMLAGVAYGAVEYRKISKLNEKSANYTKNENYKEAIKELDIAQSSWLVQKFGIKKKTIKDEIDKTNILLEDKTKYEEALLKFNNEYWQEAIDLFSTIPDQSFYYQKAQFKIKEAEANILGEQLALETAAKEEAERKAQEETAKRAQAEIAKRQAEEKTKQEQIARKQAEDKAQQEEEAKKIAQTQKEQAEKQTLAKQQELQVKEAEEARLNADNDGDGLTYRRELELGTSDWNTDSDGDGIKDGEDAHPAGGGRNLAQNFEWFYEGKNWSWTYSIHEDWYEYYKNRPRTSQGLEYVTKNDPFIKEVAKALNESAQKEGYAISLFITSFVQGLPYVQDAYTSFNEYPKYPIETFVERNGDCEDTSYLAASLVDASGYGSAFVELPGHMAIAIKAVSSFAGYYYDLDDGRYYFFETTGKDWKLGEMPNEYINKQAKITRIWDGKIINSYPKYKKPCYSSPDFVAYYYDGSNYYSDSQCNNLVYCLPYKEYYVNPQITTKLYWDSICSQEVTIGCYKSTNYPGYFSNGLNYYSDSRCSQKARLCRPALYPYDQYYDGSDNYWDSSCTQKVVSWCSKSIYYPGYFFNSIDSKIYIDYQCTQLKE